MVAGRRLDFLGIGAAKSGTTALHEYLATHPELYLPPAKEYVFFTADSNYDKGWEEFAAFAFRDAPPERLCGKVTPWYLGGPVAWREETVRNARAPAHVVTACRIAKQSPDVKLIVLLRDPVERAVSAYWEGAKHQWADRTLAEAFEHQLSPERLEAARAHPTIQNSIIAPGEYGRLLEGWLEVFPREQMFIGSAHVLASDPESLMRDLWRFLGVDDSHVPPNLDTRYNTRAYRRRIGFLRPAQVMRAVKRTPGLRHAWEGLPPAARNRARARFHRVAWRFYLWNQVSGAAAPQSLDPELQERLREHYTDDLTRLAELVGAVPGVTAGDPVPSAA